MQKITTTEYMDNASFLTPEQITQLTIDRYTELVEKTFQPYGPELPPGIDESGRVFGPELPRGINEDGSLVSAVEPPHDAHGNDELTNFPESSEEEEANQSFPSPDEPGFNRVRKSSQPDAPQQSLSGIAAAVVLGNATGFSKGLAEAILKTEDPESSSNLDDDEDDDSSTSEASESPDSNEDLDTSDDAPEEFDDGSEESENDASEDEPDFDTPGGDEDSDVDYDEPSNLEDESADEPLVHESSSPTEEPASSCGDEAAADGGG